jgi:mitochondrial-processing peptidase subunit alpha
MLLHNNDDPLLLFLYLQRHGSSRLASTSVVKPSSGGLFGWLLGGKSSQLPPLNVPLPGITIPPPLPDFVEPAKTKITTLPNGVKIASETSPVSHSQHFIIINV